MKTLMFCQINQMSILEIIFKHMHLQRKFLHFLHVGGRLKCRVKYMFMNVNVWTDPKTFLQDFLFHVQV